MDKRIVRQVTHVRAQLSNVFTSQKVNHVQNIPKTSRKTVKSKKKVLLTTRVKSQMVFPSISIHRNPLSCTTDREIIRYPPLQRRKSFSKGSFMYKLAVKKSDEHFDWDNIVQTCSRLLKPRFEALSP
jgi:hypothetical protein